MWEIQHRVTFLEPIPDYDTTRRLMGRQAIHSQISHSSIFYTHLVIYAQYRIVGYSTHTLGFYESFGVAKKWFNKYSPDLPMIMIMLMVWSLKT